MSLYKNLILLSLFFCICVSCKFQTRAISRITGEALELQLPEDFDRAISYSSGRKGEKDLFYYTKNGEMKVKTYTDFGVFESEIIFTDTK